jgi:hypothetical protein
MAIKNTALTTVASNVYVSSGNSVVTTVHLCNYSGSQVQANVYVVPAGFTANTLTVIYGNVAIPAYNTLIIYQEKFVLANGDAIMANVSANSSVSTTTSTMGF